MYLSILSLRGINYIASNEKLKETSIHMWQKISNSSQYRIAKSIPLNRDSKIKTTNTNIVAAFLICLFGIMTLIWRPPAWE